MTVALGNSRRQERRETFSAFVDFMIQLAIFLLLAFAFLHLFALESGGKSGKHGQLTKNNAAP